MKQCTKCKEVQPLSNFTPARYGKPALKSVCSLCNTTGACLGSFKSPLFEVKRLQLKLFRSLKCL